MADAEEPYVPASNVIEALARCIADVTAVGKDSRNNEQKYNFRGVDAVVNAAHPVLAKHRVVITPYAAQPNYTPTTSKSGTAGRFCDLKLTYRVYGPGGPSDSIDVTVFGESADYGDKATAKAFSVAYRIVLLQVLNLPTDDPDPDAGAAFEHVSARTAQAAAVPDEPRELGEARTRVQAAWNYQYGTWVKTEAESAYTKWCGGVLMEATAGELRKFAAYLSTLPVADAGGEPGVAPPAGDAPSAGGGKITVKQRGQLFVLLGEIGLTAKADQLRWINKQLQREYESRTQITFDDAKVLIDALTKSGVDITQPAAPEPPAEGDGTR